MPRIRKIEIRNFRSIRRLTCELTDYSVLVGDNDVGKSNILRALNLFFNDETTPNEPLNFQNDYNRYEAGVAKKAQEIVVQVELELPANYHRTNGQRIRWTKRWRSDGLVDDRDYVGLRESRSARGKIRHLVVDIPGRSMVHTLLRRLNFEYVPAVRSADFFSGLRGRIYGVIAEVAEKTVRESSEEFQAAIGAHVLDLITSVKESLGDETSLTLPTDLSGVFERLDFRSGEGGISLDYRGDGIKGRYIPLILKFIADQRKTIYGKGGPSHTFIWAYEEPENNLEILRAGQLAQQFLGIAEGDLTQIIVTTHSPVFFNAAIDSPELGSTHFVDYPANEIGTRIESEPSDLGGKMGVMSLVAPYLAAAQDEIDRVLEQNADLCRQIDEQAARGLPTLFVEGITEYRLLQAVFERLRPGLRERVFLPEPPVRAGATYVQHQVMAWCYKQKNQPRRSRVLVGGILDRDGAGKTAMEAANGHLKGEKTAFLELLPVPDHLVAAHEAGVAIPIALEELYPIAWWREAEENGWLGPRDLGVIMSPTLINQLVRGDENQGVFEQPWAIVAQNEVLEAAKVLWLNHIIEKRDDDFAEGLASVLAVLDGLVEKIAPN